MKHVIFLTSDNNIIVLHLSKAQYDTLVKSALLRAVNVYIHPGHTNIINTDIPF